MGGDCGVYGEDNGIEKFLVRKSARKRRLEKSRRRWVISNVNERNRLGGSELDPLAEDRDKW
jgi:hypothetical protein